MCQPRRSMFVLSHYHFLFTLSALLALTYGCVKEPDWKTPPVVLEEGEIKVPVGFEFAMQKSHGIEIIARNESGFPVKSAKFSIYDAPRSDGGHKIAEGVTDETGVYRFTSLIASHLHSVYAYTQHPDILGGQEINLKNGNITFVFEPVSYARKTDATLVAEICGNGMDDDGDGLFDCADPDCDDYPACSDCYSCQTNFYQRIGDYFKQLDISLSTYQQILGPNAVLGALHGGYNTRDGYFYAVNSLTNAPRLYKITRGSVIESAPIVNCPAKLGVAADMDTSGNLLVYNALKLAKINTTTLVATEQTFPNPGGNTTFADIVYDPVHDFVYGMGSTCIFYKMDLSHNTITAVADYSFYIRQTGGFGAAWTDSDGSIYVSQNATGKIFQIFMDANGDPLDIELKIYGEITGNNDGFSCPFSDAPSFEIPYNEIDDDGDGFLDCADRDLSTGDYCIDGDGDGVYNALDAYPTDGNASQLVYFPGENVFGAYAFEDQWPRKGDYDFNDLVMDYQYRYALNNQGEITRLRATYRVAAVGGVFQMGFGIQLDNFTPSQITSVTGTQTSTITKLSNGCEGGQSKAVIVVLDNAHALMGATPGTIINTQYGSLTTAPYEITIEIDLEGSHATIGEINPFIFTKGERFREIHFKNMAPTDLADTRLFGTEDDNTTGTQTYQTSSGMPWGLNLPVSFTHPREQISILDAFPDFYDWVLSASTTNQDWYLPANSVLEKRVQRE